MHKTCEVRIYSTDVRCTGGQHIHPRTRHKAQSAIALSADLLTGYTGITEIKNKQMSVCLPGHFLSVGGVTWDKQLLCNIYSVTGRDGGTGPSQATLSYHCQSCTALSHSKLSGG